MNRNQPWLDELRADLYQLDIQGLTGSRLGEATTIAIPSQDWGRAAQALRTRGWRWSSFWADEVGDYFRICTLLEKDDNYVLMRCQLKSDEPKLPSQASVFPAADRPERHCRDLYGIEFIGAPDNRRWTRHQAWGTKTFPLLATFAQEPQKDNILGDVHYPFLQTAGGSVYEIPVGPIHAGIIEPGHFRFQAIGETILNLEERFGYAHKGIEKLAQGRDSAALLKLAARVSGDAAVANAWAAAQALEQAQGIAVPQRALYLRALLLERERVANHIGDIGAICNDVGFIFAQTQTSRMRELWQRQSMQLFGHRLLMDTLTLGGVSTDVRVADVESMHQELKTMGRDFDSFVSAVDDYPTLDDRLATSGVLPHQTAQELGCLGYVARASGVDFDVRRNVPFAPYDQFKPRQVLHFGGDVLSRVRVRIDEVHTSLELLSALLHGLPDGVTQAELPQISGIAEREGLGIVEGWRGETLCYVRLNKQGLVQRYFPRDPSWNNWPALECLIDGNIVADFPVCNKSINGSYSGVDL